MCLYTNQSVANYFIKQMLGGVMVRTLYLQLSVAVSIPGHDTARLFLK